jgi:hypothetical protein
MRLILNGGNFSNLKTLCKQYISCGFVVIIFENETRFERKKYNR